MIHDRIVRNAFHKSVLKGAHESNDTLVVDELGLRNGESRADIAVLNGKLIGYEIKTDKDKLHRLPDQIQAYNEVFDSSFIVTSTKHLAKAKAIIPTWWGIYLIEDYPSEISFKLVRKAKANKERTSMGIVKLLWKTEVWQIIDNVSELVPKRNSNKLQLYEELVSAFTTEQLCQLTLFYLKNRQGWRKGPIGPW
jgi:hypothetical protein